MRRPTDPPASVPDNSAQQRGLAAAVREYDVRALEPAEVPKWEEFVRQSPQGTLFHSTLWMEASGIPFKLLGCFRGSELRGGFAAGIVGDRSAGQMHPALTPYLGILFPKADAKYVSTLSMNKEIASAFAAFLKREYDSVQFRFPPEVIDLQPFIWEGFQVGVRYTYRLDLTDLGAAWQGMDARRRTDIRSAERAGVAVEGGNALATVLEMSAKTFRRQGLELAFRMAAERFDATLVQAGRARSFIARDRDGRELGAVYIVWDHKRAYYLIGGYDSEAGAGDACSLALWQAICFTAGELKLLEFDFEGSMIPAVERFFRKFGGTLMPTYTIWYDKRGRTELRNFPGRVVRKIARLAGLTDR